MAGNRRSLAHAVMRCEELVESRGVQEMALVIPTKDRITGLLAAHWDAEALLALERANLYRRRGMVVHLLTKKIQRRRVVGPVLAIAIEADALASAVPVSGVTDVIYVPESQADLAAYLRLQADSEPINVLTRVK
jgi:hypothetical protein